MLRITRASVHLAERFNSRHGEQRDCSKTTKIPQHRLCRFAKGEAFPRADESYVLEEEYGIPSSWWSQPLTPAPTPANDAEAPPDVA